MLRKGTYLSATLLGGAGLALLGACNQAGVTNAAPRLSSDIPDQLVVSGSALSLDLTTYVDDRETAPAALTYSVVSGGGSFTGTTYSNTFETFGRYPVTVRVTDPQGKSLDTTFEVDVCTANLAVITSGSDLRLLDTDTLQTRWLASGNGGTLTARSTLDRGHVVYEHQNGSDYDLYLYNAYDTSLVTLGEDVDARERFKAEGSEAMVLFTVANTAGEVLKIHDVRTGSTQVIAATTATGGTIGNVLVDSLGFVYFEFTRLGETTIYEYNTSTLATRSLDMTAVNGERRLLDVLSIGGVLVASVASNSGTKLWQYGYTRNDIALVTATSPTFPELSYKLLAGKVALGNADVVIWDPLARALTPVAATGVNEDVALYLPNGNLVYHVMTGGTDKDVVLFDAVANTSRLFPVSAVADTAVGNLTDNRVIVSKVEATGTHLYLATYASNTVTEAPIATTASQDFALVQVLANNKIVYRNTTSGGVFLFNPGNSSTTSIGATAVFVAEMPTSGDFVVKVDNGGQFDLVLWDDSATTTVTIANTGSEEESAVGVGGGRILFTREVTTRNLFQWNPTGPTETQVTNDTVEHAVVTTFSVDKR